MEKYIPVVVIKELSETDKILKALKNAGINCAEITFRTACAAEAIAYAAKKEMDNSKIRAYNRSKWSGDATIKNFGGQEYRDRVEASKKKAKR